MGRWVSRVDGTEQLMLGLAAGSLPPSLLTLGSESGIRGTRCRSADVGQRAIKLAVQLGRESALIITEPSSTANANASPIASGSGTTNCNQTR